MLTEIQFPEIFIGLVAPVGVDTTEVIREITSFFDAVFYDVIPVKVTDSFGTFQKYLKPEVDLKQHPYVERVKSHISYGNQVRRSFNDASILATASASMIQLYRRRADRDVRTKKSPPTFKQRVFILNQFKRPEEVDLLRRIYGQLFFQISVYSRKGTRISNIARRIESEKQFGDTYDAEGMARGLVAQDEDEVTDKFGQRVTNTFHDADFIINTDSSSKSVHDQIRRFGELLFGSNTISPTRDEYGLYAAKVSALRTLDLSRQVGAAIFSPHGEVLALGSNEVPKARGGTYWDDGTGLDAREYVLKVDTNDRRKKLVIRELYSLVKQGKFSEDEFENFLTREDVKSSRAMDAIEYGRMVHAEMNALTDAARVGHAVRAATLYCTTFPCHICAKHIVASGIDRVVYLEPYPKSLAQDLHEDSLEVDGQRTGRFDDYNKVKFDHFFGVTPRRYREFFERGKRKGPDGRLVDYIKDQKRPIVRVIQPFYSESERLSIVAGFEALKHVASNTQK
ncbi:Deoxycytidylate deaminase [Devosia sp. YR412]|uniref:anti-phage dCTP deaminase n=1 Tax=Devosia sp. YR412 TaxID=1881030 RepID=UPI0008D19793|nr:anti-phage dCTP deaminase [Devosia sp. YR412]SEQ02904.1 Deoxycytidylate deaminase [Devosia sp. YR412]